MSLSLLLPNVYTVLLLALACLGAPVQAQSSTTTNPPPDTKQSTPFKLNAQKYHKGDGTNAPSPGLRIQRVNEAYPKIPSDLPLRGLTGPQIDVGDFQLHAENGTLQESTTTDAPIPGKLSVQALAKFDVELIVDQSLSMRRRDCPGGNSRWEWCGNQLRELSDQLAPFAPGGFTLTTFAAEFQSYDHATSAEVQHLFEHPNFAFGTMLAGPLNARMNHYFEGRTALSKPLLIVVITDGAPAPAAEPRFVANALIAASKRIVKPGELTIVFFQIGGADRFGRHFLNQMDNSLMTHGARYDIVQTVPFEYLQEQGLTQSLVSVVRTFAHQASR